MSWRQCCCSVNLSHWTQGKLGDFRPRQSVLHALARSPLLRAPCHRPDRVASVATRTQDVRACKQWLQHPQQSETQLNATGGAVAQSCSFASREQLSEDATASAGFRTYAGSTGPTIALFGCGYRGVAISDYASKTN